MIDCLVNLIDDYGFLSRGVGTFVCRFTTNYYLTLTKGGITEFTEPRIADTTALI
ncbi:MAG: hypothetical protein AAF632_17985 [Bacteroidota bacterium]